jgi:hypothetical protein
LGIVIRDFFFIFFSKGLSPSHIPSSRLDGLTRVDSCFFVVAFFKNKFLKFCSSTLSWFNKWVSIFYSIWFLKSYLNFMTRLCIWQVNLGWLGLVCFVIFYFFLISSFNIWFARNWVKKIFFIFLYIGLSPSNLSYQIESLNHFKNIKRIYFHERSLLRYISNLSKGPNPSLNKKATRTSKINLSIIFYEMKIFST